jgi:hypothetical protein
MYITTKQQEDSTKRRTFPPEIAFKGSLFFVNGGSLFKTLFQKHYVIEAP